MKAFTYFGIFYLLLNLVSCEESMISTENKSVFQEPFQRTLKTNLSKKWGDTLIIKQNDEVRSFYLTHDHGENSIYEIGKGLFFKGEAVSYKGLYFLSEQVDSCYKIFAVQEDKGTFIGFPEIQNQLDELDKAVEQGLVDELLIERNNKRYLLKTDKKKIHELYLTQLIGLPIWKKVLPE